MSCKWIRNTIRKKSNPKNRKSSKNQTEIAACEQKNQYRETEIQTPFSHSTLKLERKSEKNSRHKTTRFFAPFRVSAWLKSLLQFDFKNHENVCEQILKKTQPEEFRKRLEVEIHLKAIQLLIKQNVPPLL